MINKLIRLYNQNRKKVFKTIIIIASILGLIQLLNYFAANNNKIEVQTNTLQSQSNQTTSVTSNKSAITGGTISNTQLTNASNTIDSFMTYCNNGEINKAYDLLTNDCKNQLYPTLEEFNNNYYLKVFEGQKKLYTIQNWVGNIYIVNITENVLATGNVNGRNIQDYMTIQKENNESKLNINNYIGRTELNRKIESKDINISVTNKNTYMDYEIYEIKIQNNSDKDILLDDKQSTKTIYLEDTNGAKYISYSHELLEQDLLIKSGYTKTINIKFTNTYTSSRDIKYLIFSKVILDYEKYENMADKSQYAEIYKLQINI